MARMVQVIAVQLIRDSGVWINKRPLCFNALPAKSSKLEGFKRCSITPIAVQASK